MRTNLARGWVVVLLAAALVSAGEPKSAPTEGEGKRRPLSNSMLRGSKAPRPAPSTISINTTPTMSACMSSIAKAGWSVPSIRRKLC